MIKNLDIKFLIFAFAIINGCSSQPKEPVKPSTLHTITINPNVIISEKPEFKAGGEGAEWLIKKAGFKLEDRADTLKLLIANQRIDLQQLLLKNIKEQITDSKLPILIVDNNSEADLQLTIESYGLMFALEGKMIPTITVKIAIVNRSGSTIWENSENVSNTDEFRDGMSVHSWPAYKEIPALLDQDFKATIKLATKKQIEELKEDYFSGGIDN